MLGNECPECNVRLVRDKCPECGWQSKVVAAPADDWQRCQRCSDTSKNTTYFHDDGAPEDRGVRLCPSCWIPALRRRAERDPISVEQRAALRHDLYRHLDTIAARVLVKPTRGRETGSMRDMVDRSAKAEAELERYRRHLDEGRQ